MQYRLLGRTGVEVSPLCLGAMIFGPWGNEDEADSVRIIHRALDAGINLIDTADVYSAGVSEEIVGKALKDRRDEIVAPGVTVNPVDNSYGDFALRADRRRRLHDRARRPEDPKTRRPEDPKTRRPRSPEPDRFRPRVTTPNASHHSGAIAATREAPPGVSPRTGLLSAVQRQALRQAE
ncbi:hypothetical protein GCM10023335_56920 [Streptomyces siamensis]|uniref:NADP-dependent oxidoreductase domain-containing protein n=1 Tax=Streptomyces siamensis TaxID=1274986 RepID=A0ABP9JA18_9ACTN